jgi:hypothetical protein
MSAGSRVRRWGLLAAEACGSLLLILALFWLFITFLYALFPSGTPLRELVESRMAPAQGRLPAKRQAEATLSSLLRDVRLRRGNSIAWGGAREGMQLYSQDAVQTFDRSGACISFGGSDRLDVGSNSLVVVTRMNADEETGKRSYRVQVDGEMHGSLSAGRKLNLEFSAAGHLARIVPGAARFRISPYGERSANLAVYAGEARVSDNGRTVRVPANYGVVLKNGVAVGAAVALPAAPLPGESARALYRYRLLPPRLRFSWSGAAGDYHFQLCTSPDFKSCVFDDRLGTAEFVTGKLDQGTYFWRVSRLERGMEGSFSAVGRCELLQVLNSPELQVDFPAESLETGRYLLSGRSEPGARIFVDGLELAAGSTGKFERELPIKPGVNLIRVEALDTAGNASYASRIVYGRSGRQGSVFAIR